MGTASGVFKTGASSDNNVYATTTTVSIGKDDGVSLDLSRSSSLFSGTKLQAPALQVLACVRFWCKLDTVTQGFEPSSRRKLHWLLTPWKQSRQCRSCTQLHSQPLRFGLCRNSRKRWDRVPHILYFVKGHSIHRPGCLAMWPNMFGQFHDLHSGERVGATGVFKYLNYGNTGTFAGSDNKYGDFDFDSSRSSSIYSGTQLQPKALQTLACIRC